MSLLNTEECTHWSTCSGCQGWGHDFNTSLWTTQKALLQKSKAKQIKAENISNFQLYLMYISAHKKHGIPSKTLLFAFLFVLFHSKPTFQSILLHNKKVWIFLQYDNFHHFFFWQEFGFSPFLALNIAPSLPLSPVIQISGFHSVSMSSGYWHSKLHC